MRTDHLFALAKGALTWVPGLYERLSRKAGGGTDSADYCRGVWLKHLGWSGLEAPGVVAEIGPGDSIGCGIAALMSGAQAYYTIDARPSDSPERNRQIALALGAPESILSRVHRRHPPDNAVDFLFSHSVLEHVADLPAVMADAFRCLKPGAVMSHQFDLESHGITRRWDGHRAFGDLAWKVVVGGRPFLINRLPYSAVLDCIRDAGFEIVADRRVLRDEMTARQELRGAWAGFLAEDLRTSGGIIQAKKPLSR